MTANMRTFTVNFKEQRSDGLVDAGELIASLQHLVKVRGSVTVAQRDINYKNLETAIEIGCKREDLKKEDLKLYLKRVLSKKGLKLFIKVSGGTVDEINFNYVYIETEQDDEADDS